MRVGNEDAGAEAVDMVPKDQRSWEVAAWSRRHSKGIHAGASNPLRDIRGPYI